MKNLTVTNLERFVDELLEVMSTDYDKFLELTSQDIKVEFAGMSTLIPCNADTIDALAVFLKLVEEDAR